MLILELVGWKRLIWWLIDDSLSFFFRVLYDLKLNCDCKLKRLFGYLKNKEIEVLLNEKSVCESNEEIKLAGVETSLAVCTKQGSGMVNMNNNRLRIELVNSNGNKEPTASEGDRLVLKCYLPSLKAFKAINWWFNGKIIDKSKSNMILNERYSELAVEKCE